MTTLNTQQKWTPVERLGLLVGVVLVLVLTWPIRNYVTDDTFIHLQYARHLAEGKGLAFNVGEHSYGCTSPLWVALLADAIALGFDGLAAARTIGLIATLASVGLFMQLLRRTMRVPELRALATVVWAGHAWMIRWSVSGMETPLAVALVLAGFVAYTEGQQWGSRPLRTGALWSLAALTRPEAALLLGLWGVFLLVDADSRNGVRRLFFGLLPPLVIYGGWLVFAKFYFGTFWPETLSAKTASGTGLAFQLDNLWRQVRIISATDGLLAVLLVVALGFGGPRMFPRSSSQHLLPWAWLIGIPLLYSARGVPVISRYLLPLLPVLGWLTWRAFERWWVGEKDDPARISRAVVFGWAIAAVVLAQNLTVYRTTVVPHVQSFTRGMRESLIPWGKWFRDHTPPDAMIAAPDIGALGYYSQRRLIDLAGLVTPQMIPLLREELPENIVANLSFNRFARPGYLVDRASVANDLLARSPYAAALLPIGHAGVPNLGIARPTPAVYTFYAVDWARFDSLDAHRSRALAPPR